MKRKRHPVLNPSITSLLPLAAFLLALGLSPGCGSSGGSDDNNDTSRTENPPTVGEASIRTLEIQPNKETCHGSAPQLCYVVREPGGEVELVYENIEGLNWSWGHTITAEVEVSDVATPTTDGATKLYRVRSVVSDTVVPVGTSFESDINRDFVAASPNCQFNILGQVSFSTRFPDQCTQLNQALSNGERLIGKFTFSGQGSQPLVLDSFRSSDIVLKRDWARVELESRPNVRPTPCTKLDRFIVRSNGTYQYSNCNGSGNGRLSAEDFAQVKDAAERLESTQPEKPLVCDNVESFEIVELDMTFTNAERIKLYRKSLSGTCVRGDREVVANLQFLLRDIENRTVGTGPAPAPTPAASPAPAPGPTATPVETATPAAPTPVATLSTEIGRSGR